MGIGEVSNVTQIDNVSLNSGAYMFTIQGTKPKLIDGNQVRGCCRVTIISSDYCI